MELEIWKDIPGFEGLYQASDFGRIKSLKKKRSNGMGFYLTEERILKNQQNKNGYSWVGIGVGENRKLYLVSRLILMSFLGMPRNGEVACHFPDRSHKNNRFDNLRWDTQKNNKSDELIHGTRLFGEKNNNAKLNSNQIIEIKQLLKMKIKHKEIAIKFNVCRENITAINRGTSWNWLTV